MRVSMGPEEGGGGGFHVPRRWGAMPCGEGKGTGRRRVLVEKEGKGKTYEAGGGGTEVCVGWGGMTGPLGIRLDQAIGGCSWHSRLVWMY